MAIPRRSFLRSAVSGCSLLAAPLFTRKGWASQAATTPPTPQLHPVAAGQDRFGPPRTLGFSSLAFKVATDDAAGNLFVIEHKGLQPNSGPPLHLHYLQDEWFYVMEGNVVFLVGGQQIALHAGESVLAPRGIAHTFSAAGSPAHLLIAFTPAGKMEQYFVDATAHPALAATADFMNRYEMQWLGPSPFWKK